MNERLQMYDVEQINHLIRNRRSIFTHQYTGEIIPREIIAQILENARWAPTHGKTEPWFFYVFEGQGKMKICNFIAELYKKTTPEEDFKLTKYEKHLEKAVQASHIIAICMKRGTNSKIPWIEEIEAVACAVQNMYLTATAYGLGCYWSSGNLAYLPEMKEQFGLGEEDQMLGFFYIGYPQTIPNNEVERTPIIEKIEWIIE